MGEVGPLEREHSLSVLLPGGTEKSATVHGSKPVMDLLVTLCASHHLNPADYTVEVLSSNKNNVTFKPNSPIGSLEAEKIVLKPKAAEDKARTPYVPEASVRLLINYNRCHKAVVRVNPTVPLETLLPLVSDKCEFKVESTVLCRDSESRQELDLSKTLNELGLREVFARDTEATEASGDQPRATSIASTKVSSSSSLQDLTKREKKKSESKGFFSLFRKHRKKSEPTHAASAPSSPGPTKSRSASVSTQDRSLCSTPVAGVPKKRPAPQPPMGAFHSFPNNLSSCHLQGPQSAENTLRSTKRKAPPPPVVNHHQEAPDDTEKECLNPLEEEKESVDRESVGPSSSPSSTLPHPLHKDLDLQRTSIRGKDLSDARAALAKVLTNSLSSGSLIKRLKNTTTSTQMHNGSSEHSVEMMSVLNSNLPTDDVFEEPQGKTGLTTFQMVPSRKESDAEPIPEVAASDRAEADAETVEQVRAETDSSVKEENSDDQSVNGSCTNCPDEETISCPFQLDNQNEDSAERPEQVGASEDVTEEIMSDQSHESATNEDDSVEMATGEDKNSVEITTVLHSHLQTGNEFEDPLNKTGLTTFKVVPSRRESDSEPTQNVLEKKGNDTKPETEERVIPDSDPSTNAEESLDQSEPISCSEEGETAPCPLQLDNQSEESSDKLNQDQMRLTEDIKEQNAPDESQECVPSEGDLYLGEEEVDKECSITLNTNDMEKCDDKAEKVAQEDDGDHFPPPPPPVYFNDDLEEASGSISVSAPIRGVTNGHMRSNSEPPQTLRPSPGDTDRMDSAPSRFAQAVALAVQRSRLHSTGKTISALFHQEA